jgi:prepilin-type N-terminal cleavage/methylation domain-containing protein/prepilin-type processing-associated H-X9-DG protein
MASSRKAFTLVELLVVISIIGVLMALLLPAVQGARESMRRSQCQNNLHQISVAIQSYHEKMRHFPTEAFGGPGNSSQGFSWWVQILPHMDQKVVYNMLCNGGVVGSPGTTGSTLCLYSTSVGTNGVLYGWSGFASATCPSSSLQTMGNNNIFRPNYVGISGSVAHSTSATFGTGTVSYGGVLIANNLAPGGSQTSAVYVSYDKITHGSANTMMVAEQSDYCYDGNGNKVDYRSDAISSSDGDGFASGVGPGFTRIPNLTVVQYGINTKSVGGANSPNSAIQSVHSGGAFVAMADGSVRFLNQNISMNTLRGIADREPDTGIVIPENY